MFDHGVGADLRELVDDDAQGLEGFGSLGEHAFAQALFQQGPAIDPNLDVSASEPQGIEQGKDRADQFGFCGDFGLSPDIHIPLEMLALAPPGHALVTPVLAHGEPARGHAERPRPGHYHAGHRGGHLRAQRQVAVVHLEVVELVDDFLPRLAGEEFGVLHHGGVHFLERKAVRHASEVIEEPLAAAEVLRVEIPGPARGLKGILAQNSASPIL